MANLSLRASYRRFRFIPRTRIRKREFRFLCDGSHRNERYEAALATHTACREWRIERTYGRTLCKRIFPERRKKDFRTSSKRN